MTEKGVVTFFYLLIIAYTCGVLFFVNKKIVKNVSYNNKVVKTITLLLFTALLLYPVIYLLLICLDLFLQVIEKGSIFSLTHLFNL